MKLNYKIFNSFDLKIIALFTMILDHLGEIFFPNIFLLRIIGRVSFIIYAFLISEGISYTHNLKLYLAKLLLWAFLSEIPFDFALFKSFFFWDAQNVFWTLFISVFAISFSKTNINLFLKIFILSIAPFLSYIFKCDYSWYGVILIYVFYFLRKFTFSKNLIISFISVLFACFSFFAQIFYFIGLVPIALYNGKLGKKFGNVYYSFYSIHLMLFGIIRYFLRL